MSVIGGFLANFLTVYRLCAWPNLSSEYFVIGFFVFFSSYDWILRVYVFDDEMTTHDVSSRLSFAVSDRRIQGLVEVELYGLLVNTRSTSQWATSPISPSDGF